MTSWHSLLTDQCWHSFLTDQYQTYRRTYSWNMETHDMPLMAPGTYRGEISGVEELAAKSSGKPTLLIKWVVNGVVVFDYYSLQPKAIWRLRNLLKALNVPFTDDGFEARDLIGCEAMLRIEHNTWNGRTYNRVLAAFTPETLPAAQEILSMTPLDILKRAYPDQDVESLLKVLEGAA